MVTRHAAIVGAGISGLASAVALRNRGWSVTVLERADALAQGGTALGMWPEAMAALDDLGIGEEVRTHAVFTRGATILDPTGREIARISDARQAHLVSRARLLNALYNALPADTVVWGSRITSVADLPDADLVVGADGIHSRVRASLWPQRSERPLGTIAYRGVVGGEAAGVTETWGKGMLFGITPSSDGLVNWFACLRSGLCPPDSSRMTAVLAERFGSWHPAVADIVSRIEDHEIDRRELCDVVIRHPYVRGNAAIVGDAAHAMAPNLGRGACESLLDAVALARALDSGDVGSGLRRYDRHRRRTRRVVRAARALNRLATAQRATVVRDATLRALTARSSALAQTAAVGS